MQYILMKSQPSVCVRVCTCGSRGDDRCVCIHVFNEVLGHSLQLFHFPHIKRNASTWDKNWARG